MNDIQLIIDGKEYICRPVEETDAVESERPRTGYERVDADEDCWHIYDERVEECYEDGCGNNDDIYAAGNYYNDEQLAIDNGRAEMLMRRIRQWQALNDEPVNWEDDNTEQWYIAYKYTECELLLFVATSDVRNIGNVYFSSSQAADEARDIFRDELMWYFTEYRQRLDEPKGDK